MVALNLPSFETNIKMRNGKPFILDILRQKFVALTPEEWVRQHFIRYLIEHKGYPQALLANEVPLKVGDKKLRADSVLYTRELRPRMIIEYKAPDIAISQKVFEQIAAYNTLLHVDYILASNGLQTVVFKVDYKRKKYLFIAEVPDYEKL